MAIKRKTADIWKKKEWYVIVAPKMFEEKEVGATPADKEEKLLNRVIEVPLREITGNIQHQFIKLLFRVVEVKAKKAYTDFDGFALVREYLKRNVRRRRSLISTIQTMTTKDGKKIQVTAHIFTARKVKASQKRELRQKMAEVLVKTASERNFEDIIQQLVFGAVSAEIFKNVKTLAQVKRVELEKCEVIR